GPREPPAGQPVLPARAGRAPGSRLRPVPAAGLGQTTPAALARPAAPWGWALGPAAARRPTDRRTDQGAGCRRPLGRTGQPDPAYRRGAPAAVRSEEHTSELQSREN